MNRKWDKSRPPTGAFQLNKNCPQAQGLISWFPWGGFYPSLVWDMGLRRNTNPAVVNGATQSRIGQYGEKVGSFVQASSQYFEGLTESYVSTSISMSAWCVPDASIQTPICFAGAHSAGLGGTLDFQRIVLVSGVARANSCHTQGTQANAISVTAYTAGAWNFFSASFASTTSRTIYTNGKAPVSNTTSIVAGTLFSPLIGAGVDLSSTYIQFMQGQIGECAIWGVSLSPDIHARLYDPLTRYELWYPLRSPKWISMPTEAAAGGLRFHPGMEGQMSKRMDGGLNA